MATPSILTGERPRLDSYSDWLLQKHNESLDQRLENHYSAVCQSAIQAFEHCDVWSAFVKDIREFQDEYLIINKYQLMSGPSPKILAKPYKSFIEKTFRKNIVMNSNFPEPPDGGWYLPNNWYSRINDLIRTTLTVNYLDGVEFLLSKLQATAKSKGTDTSCDYEAKFEGYYAVHLYYQKVINIPKMDFSSQLKSITFEVQITTQIKEIVKSILHSFYEQARTSPASSKNSKDWRWDYKSDEFAANNLGHVVHYIEGMIMQVRDKRRGGEL